MGIPFGVELFVDTFGERRTGTQPQDPREQVYSEFKMQEHVKYGSQFSFSIARLDDTGSGREGRVLELLLSEMSGTSAAL